MLKRKKEIEFEQWLSSHISVIDGLCIQICSGNTFFYEEIKQECLIELWIEYRQYGFSRFRAESSETTWIYTVCRHAVWHYIRTKQNDELHTEDEECLDRMIENVIYCDQWTLTDELMEMLPTAERSLVEHFINDDAYSTIARAHGITESTARKRMSRLMKKLKEFAKR